MNLIDPSTRWWNQGGPRRSLAWACWTLAVAVFFVGGWTLTEATDPNADTSPYFPRLLVGGLVLVLAGEFAYFLSGDAEDFDLRAVLFPVAAIFVAQGLGDVAHALLLHAVASVTSIMFVVVGVCAFAVAGWASRVLTRRRAMRALVERSEISTSGTVTRARGYYSDCTPVTRVTARFTDAVGQTRWASQTIGGDVKVGARVVVRYLPEYVDRKGGVILSSS